jgi:hypothetical protein
MNEMKAKAEAKFDNRKRIIPSNDEKNERDNTPRRL